MRAQTGWNVFRFSRQRGVWVRVATFYAEITWRTEREARKWAGERFNLTPESTRVLPVGTSPSARPPKGMRGAPKRDESGVGATSVRRVRAYPEQEPDWVGDSYL